MKGQYLKRNIMKFLIPSLVFLGGSSFVQGQTNYEKTLDGKDIRVNKSLLNRTIEEIKEEKQYVFDTFEKIENKMMGGIRDSILLSDLSNSVGFISFLKGNYFGKSLSDSMENEIWRLARIDAKGQYPIMVSFDALTLIKYLGNDIFPFFEKEFNRLNFDKGQKNLGEDYLINLQEPRNSLDEFLKTITKDQESFKDKSFNKLIALDIVKNILDNGATKIVECPQDTGKYVINLYYDIPEDSFFKKIRSIIPKSIERMNQYLSLEGFLFEPKDLKEFKEDMEENEIDRWKFKLKEAEIIGRRGVNKFVLDFKNRGGSSYLALINPMSGNGEVIYNNNIQERESKLSDLELECHYSRLLLHEFGHLALLPHANTYSNDGTDSSKGNLMSNRVGYTILDANHPIGGHKFTDDQINLLKSYFSKGIVYKLKKEAGSDIGERLVGILNGYKQN